MKFVAVTSCPTGIAHTYMAAENLEQTGKDQGHDVQVETQGSAGTIPLSDEVIAAADGVIFAADLEVKGKERFAGKPFVDVGVKAAVHKPLDVMAAAVAAVENAPKAGTPAAAAAAAAGPKASSGPATRKVGVGTRVRQWLMTGVSYMIPFVAAGGILIALGLLVRRRGGRLQALRLGQTTWRNMGGRPVRRYRRQPAGGFTNGQNFDTAAGSTPASPGSCSSSARSPSSCWCRSCPAIIAFAIADRPGSGARHRRRPAGGSTRCRIPRRSGLRLRCRRRRLLPDPAQGAEGCPRQSCPWW